MIAKTVSDSKANWFTFHGLAKYNFFVLHSVG